MSNLRFVTKQKTRENTAYEVAFRINSGGLSSSGAPRYSFVFRFSEDSLKKVTANSNYLVYAIDLERERVYFKEADRITGFKISQIKRGSPYIQCSADNPDAMRKYIGNYNLVFDHEEKLYYIDFSKKRI